MRKSNMDLRAANNAKIDVQGFTDATISALSPSGERFKTTSRVYIVRNVDEVYLSLDVLVRQIFSGGGHGEPTRCPCRRMGPHRDSHRTTPARIVQHKG